MARKFSLFLRYRRVVEELDQQTVGILEVNGARAVAVRLRFLGERNSKAPDALRPFIHIFRPANDESNVVDGLNRSGLGALRKFVNREVILTGRQIDVVFIRLPFDLHQENLGVKVNRSANIFHVQGNVSKA